MPSAQEALFAAIRALDLEAVDRALEQADINCPGDLDDTPLAEAVDNFCSYQWELAQAESEGREVSEEEQAERRARMMEMVRFLIEHGADVNYRDEEGI